MDHFIRTHNSDLADQLGNLLSRVTGMIDRYYEGVVPEAESSPSKGRLEEKATGLFERMTLAMNDFNPSAALAEVWELIGEANRYVVEVEPWKLAKVREDDQNERKLATVLYEMIEVLRIAAWGIAAFMPSASRSILEHLGVGSGTTRIEQQLQWGGYPAGTKVAPAPPLFPKLEAAEPPA